MIFYMRIINDFCRKNQTFLYHKFCKQKYEYKPESQLSSDTQKSVWHFKREIYQTAYEEVCSYITENVIGKRNCFFLSFFTRMYTGNL